MRVNKGCTYLIATEADVLDSPVEHFRLSHIDGVQCVFGEGVNATLARPLLRPRDRQRVGPFVRTDFVVGHDLTLVLSDGPPDRETRGMRETQQGGTPA